jgi:hypothetical protein
MKDLDVWSFFAAIPGVRFPADIRKTHADFGPSELGRQPYDLADARSPRELARYRRFATFTAAASICSCAICQSPRTRLSAPSSRHCRFGATEGLSSSHDTPLTIPRPLRRRVPWHPLQALRCRPWPSPLECRLGSLLARLRGDSLRRRRLRLMLRTGQLHRAPPRRRGLARRRGPRYRGPWRLPGPDSHRLAAVSLRSATPSTSLLPRHPSYWTHIPPVRLALALGWVWSGWCRQEAGRRSGLRCWPSCRGGCAGSAGDPIPPWPP